MQARGVENESEEEVNTGGSAEGLGRPSRTNAGRPLRILAVANWDVTTRSVPWAVQRLAALRRAGAEVEVLSEECVFDRAGFVRLWRALDRRLDAERFDVVVPVYGSVLGLLCALQRRVPCAISFAGSDLNGTVSPAGRLLFGSLPSVMASQLSTLLAAGVSVHNRSMRDTLLWPPARERSEVIPDGVDTEHFHPRPRAEARARRGFPVEGTRFVFVALRAEARASKRLDLARAAVALVPGAVLDVVDSLPFSEMPDAYAAADALLVTSCKEGSPNCVKEALACAVPVVTVDVGDVREVLAGLPNCAVVPDARPESLARALLGAISDGRGCPEGPARMATNWSITQVADRYLRFYAESAGLPAMPETVR